MFLIQGGSLRDTCIDAVTQHGTQCGHLVSAEKAAGLLDNALIALGHFRQVIINVLLGTKKCLVHVSRNAVRQFKRFGFHKLKQACALFFAELARTELCVQ